MTPQHDSRIEWHRLRTAGIGDNDLGLPSVELTTRVAAGVLRLAVGHDGEALLLIPLSSDETSLDLPQSRGLRTREILFATRGGPTRFLELACGETRLEGVFEQLVEEVSRRIEDGELAPSAVAGTIAEFRDLLEQPPSAISTEALIGLLGELITLNDLLALSPGAWRAWSGPAAGRHDFRAGSAAIECKTTRRASGNGVTISAIDQLDAPAGGDLLLRVLVIEPDSAGYLYVDTLARRVLAVASDPIALRERLEGAGWTPGAPEMQRAFSCLSDAWYQVIDGFPRIVAAAFTAGGLPVGVTGLTYTIRLDAAVPFRIEAQDASPLLETIAHAA